MLTKRDQAYIEEETRDVCDYLRREAGPGMNKFSQITRHLFICNWDSSTNSEHLRDNDIELVVCISKEQKSAKALKKYNAMRIHQVHIPLEDDPRENISVHFERFCEMIHNFCARLWQRNMCSRCELDCTNTCLILLVQGIPVIMLDLDRTLLLRYLNSS